MRFGSSVADIDALIRLLDPLAAQVAERCALVRGREQMTVRVTRTQGAEGALGALGADALGTSGAEGALRAGAKGAGRAFNAEGAGTRYLAERAANRTPPELAPLLTAVRGLQHATRIEPGRHSRVVATVYQLIDRGSSDGYRHRVEVAAATLADLTVRVSGPAPAYAFAALSAP
jgi:Gas vesicle synthesis protein GvpL/GvpF